MRMMKRCVICKATDIRMQRIRQTTEIDLGESFGKVVFVHPAFPALVCQSKSCGESYLGSADLKNLDLHIALELSRRGLVSGQAFKFMRSVLGEGGKGIAGILGITPETVSRWENGKMAIPPTMFVVLATMAEDELRGRTTTRDRLIALQCVDQPVGDIELSLPEQDTGMTNGQG